ncbi:hypothetical protein ERO13_A11G130100v2 [Gossypium hirsutum]|nr:hypothetical protein ERO13_A11G130100v2 [Gossypium hirsutum]
MENRDDSVTIETRQYEILGQVSETSIIFAYGTRPQPEISSSFLHQISAESNLSASLAYFRPCISYTNHCCAKHHGQEEDTFIALYPVMWNRGLDESVIREIPTFQFKREGDDETSVYGCVVCLNEFQQHDMLRVLPKCSHAFHLDCIDIWLQSNANCPLCRTSISGDTRYPINQIIAPSSSPQDPLPYTDSLMGGDEDFVVIELGEDDGDALLPYRQQERDNSRESLMQFQPRGQSPRKVEQKPGKLKSRRRHHLSVVGDECIDVRQKDEDFSIQPIRRSFSLDSAVDRQLYQSVQAIVQQNRHPGGITTTEECSNRGRTSLFPFEHGPRPRKAVLPV